VPRGGKRAGKPGKSYTNRTDMHQPVTTVPGQVYGQATAQQNAQKALPLPTQSTPPGGQARPTSPSSPTGLPPGGPPPVGPGDLGPLHAPTGRPDEPLTAGLPTGPGPGPAALAPPDPLTKAAAILNTLGATADPLTAQLRARVNATLNNRGAA
jgi:hypothetical protein